MTIIIERDASGKIVRYEDEAARVAGRGGVGSRGAPLGPAAPATRDEIIAEHVRAVSEARKASKVEQRRLMAELAAEVASAEGVLEMARRAARERHEKRLGEIKRRADEEVRLAEQKREAELTLLRNERRRAMDPLDQRAAALKKKHQLELDREIAGLDDLRDSRLVDLVRAADEKRQAAREAEAAPPAPEVQGA